MAPEVSGEAARRGGVVGCRVLLRRAESCGSSNGPTTPGSRMALISCSECGHKVSDKADACPSCGNPLGDEVAEPRISVRRSGGQAAVEPQVETIERTGKKYKGAMFAGGVAMVFGIILFMGGAQVLGGLLLAGGLIYYIYGRWGAWWHHA